MIYIDNLIKILRKSGFGCTIHGVYFGVMIYADDIFLLSASRSGLQQMINLSHSYAAKRNLKFGTNENPDKSKTKCIIFSKKKQNKVNLKKISLDGHDLPWVDQVAHLGHTLQVDNSMSIDINRKRGIFIGKTNSLLQEFHYASPYVLMTLLHSYACNIYGSNTWDLFSVDCQRLFTSYNVAVRNIHKLPRATHRYLLEPLTGSPHLYTLLLARYTTFVRSLLSNEAFEVRFMANLCLTDMRTVTGKSVAKISSMCNNANISNLTAKLVKETVRYNVIPIEETWRIGLMNDMRMVLSSDSADIGLSIDEATQLMEYACVS